jgi:hypothetical protein
LLFVCYGRWVYSVLTWFRSWDMCLWTFCLYYEGTEQFLGIGRGWLFVVHWFSWDKALKMALCCKIFWSWSWLLFFVSICKFDITITWNIDSLQFSIYTKPNTTDTIIPANSCHPPEQKYSAVRYFFIRIKCYPLEKKTRRYRNSCSWKYPT